MFDALDNEDVLKAADQLIPVIGVRELVNTQDLVIAAKRRDFTECVEKLAQKMGMQLRVNLTMVPKWHAHSSRSSHKSFKSTSLVYATDKEHGREGITAQVSIPDSIPLFGSGSLNGYPIDVAVSESCSNHPESFIAIMAHELSHILLSSLVSPYKDSELHTDLVPLLLGFRAIVAAGRNAIDRPSSSGNEKTVTKYGYLNDSQFDAARFYIEKTVTKHNREKKKLRDGANRLQCLIDDTAALRKEHSVLMRIIDDKAPSKMRASDAKRIVEIHSSHPENGWETPLDSAKKEIIAVQKFTANSNLYTLHWTGELTKLEEKIESHFNTISYIYKHLSVDVTIMRRYAGLKYRLRRFLMSEPICEHKWQRDGKEKRDAF